MHLIDKPISKDELQKIASEGFGNLVKAVVDISKEIMVIDASLHSDEEAHLIAKGSKQQDLWGINLYPALEGEDFVEFDSMINLRPNSGNMTRGVEDTSIQKKIRNIVSKLIK